MTLTERIKVLLKDNAWVLIAVIFFIAWKFFLISTLWEDRAIPPGPDDSFVYILHIDSSLRCDNLVSCHERAFNFDTYGGFDHLVYRVFLGSIGKVLSLDAVNTYELSFFIGTLLLIGVLIFFLSRFKGATARSIAVSLGALALYNGAGSYHGFFWIVPSFFALLIFFCILGIFLDEKIQRWKFYFLLLVPAGIFTHVLGLYLLTVLPLYIGFQTIMIRYIDWLQVRKTLFIFAIAAASYFPVGLYYSHFSYGNPYGPNVLAKHIFEKASDLGSASSTPGKDALEEEITTLSQSDPGHTRLFPGWEKVYSDYFRWIFPSSIGYIVFGICLLILASYRQFQLLSLYLASLIFSFAASLSPHGERSLILVWPITFIMYAQAAWYAFSFLHERSTQRPIFRFAAFSSLLFAVSSAIFLSASYGYLWNVYLNHSRNIAVPPVLTEYLVNLPQEKNRVAYSVDMNFLDNHLLLTNGGDRPQKTILLSEAAYYVELTQERIERDQKAYDKVFNDFFAVIQTLVFFRRQDSTTKKTHELPLNRFFSSTPIARFDDIEILPSLH